MFEIFGNTTDHFIIECKQPRACYLHSDGSVYERCIEFYPTREVAEAILAKYPDAALPEPEQPLHEWKHGDVFALKQSGNILICIHCRGGELQAFDINWCAGPAEDLAEYIDRAKFLFNINDAVDEHRAKNDVPSNDAAPEIEQTTSQVPAGLVSISEMQDFVDYAKHGRCCNSCPHICDKLANRFERILAQIERDER